MLSKVCPRLVAKHIGFSAVHSAEPSPDGGSRSGPRLPSVGRVGQLGALAARVDRGARRSAWLGHAVRAGLVAYGAVHLLVAWVAVRLTVTRGGGAATGAGALAQLADEATGRATLAVMSAAFGALVGWQVLAMAVGYRTSDGTGRTVMRIGAAARAAVYLYFAWSCASLALTGPSPQGSPRSLTARILDAPAGALVLVVVAVVVAATGVGLAVFGWRLAFLDQLDERARRSDRRALIVVLGRTGYVVKGLAFVVVGVLLAWAAVTHDPHKSGGLDQELYLLLGHALGRVAVVVVAAGLACFGLYLVARARHLNQRMITS